MASNKAEIQRLRLELEKYYEEIGAITDNNQKMAATFLKNWERFFNIIDKHPLDGYVELNELAAMHAANLEVMRDMPKAAGICNLIDKMLPSMIEISQKQPASKHQFKEIIEDKLSTHGPKMGIKVPEGGVWDIIVSWFT